MVLPAPTSPCKQAVHRCRPLHVFDDLLQRVLLSCCETERQNRARRLSDAIVHLYRPRFGFSHGGTLAQSQPDLKQEKFFEDQAHLGGRSKIVQEIRARAGWREVRVPQRRRAIGHAKPLPHGFRKGIR